jgi:hypothetical protein
MGFGCTSQELITFAAFLKNAKKVYHQSCASFIPEFADKAILDSRN